MSVGSFCGHTHEYARYEHVLLLRLSLQGCVLMNSIDETLCETISNFRARQAVHNVMAFVRRAKEMGSYHPSLSPTQGMLLDNKPSISYQKFSFAHIETLPVPKSFSVNYRRSVYQRPSCLSNR